MQHESESRAPDTETSVKHISPESELAFLPVLYTVFFLTKTCDKAFFTCVSPRREDWAFRVI